MSEKCAKLKLPLKNTPKLPKVPKKGGTKIPNFISTCKKQVHIV